MAQYKLAYSGQQIDTLLSNINNIFNLIYPVGSIYISVNNTNPGTLFGGQWTQISDTFLIAAGSTYTGGSTGGGATHSHSYAHTHTTPATTTGSHTLTIAEMPSHNHNYYFDQNSSLDWWIGLVAGSAQSNCSAIASGPQGRGYTMNIKNTGGGGGHTHDQIATTTNSQSTSTTSSESSLPPYLAVYVWKRVS